MKFRFSDKKIIKSANGTEGQPKNWLFFRKQPIIRRETFYGDSAPPRLKKKNLTFHIFLTMTEF